MQLQRVRLVKETVNHSTVDSNKVTQEFSCIEIKGGGALLQQLVPKNDPQPPTHNDEAQQQGNSQAYSLTFLPY